MDMYLVMDSYDGVRYLRYHQSEELSLRVFLYDYCEDQPSDWSESLRDLWQMMRGVEERRMKRAIDAALSHWYLDLKHWRREFEWYDLLIILRSLELGYRCEECLHERDEEDGDGEDVGGDASGDEGHDEVEEDGESDDGDGDGDGEDVGGDASGDEGHDEGHDEVEGESDDGDEYSDDGCDEEVEATDSVSRLVRFRPARRLMPDLRQRLIEVFGEGRVQ